MLSHEVWQIDCSRVREVVLLLVKEKLRDKNKLPSDELFLSSLQEELLVRDNAGDDSNVVHSFSSMSVSNSLDKEESSGGGEGMLISNLNDSDSLKSSTEILLPTPTYHYRSQFESSENHGGGIAIPGFMDIDNNNNEEYIDTSDESMS